MLKVPADLADRDAMMASLPLGYRPHKPLIDTESLMKTDLARMHAQFDKFTAAIADCAPDQEWPEPVEFIAHTW